MLSFFRKKLRGVVGLDFAQHEIRLVRLKPDGEYEAAWCHRPKDDLCTSAILELVAKTSAKKLPTIIAFPNVQAIEKSLFFPVEFSEKEISEEIIHAYLPNDKENYYYDFLIEENMNQQKIRLVIVPKKEIDALREIAIRAELCVFAIELDSDADKRVLLQLPQIALESRMSVAYGAALRGYMK